MYEWRDDMDQLAAELFGKGTTGAVPGRSHPNER